MRHLQPDLKRYLDPEITTHLYGIARFTQDL